jgi:hypothetical protein
MISVWKIITKKEKCKNTEKQPFLKNLHSGKQRRGTSQDTRRNQTDKRHSQAVKGTGRVKIRH